MQMATHRPEAHFEILSNPEFLAAGTAVQNLLYPDRVLIGSSATDSADTLRVPSPMCMRPGSRGRASSRRMSGHPSYQS